MSNWGDLEIIEDEDDDEEILKKGITFKSAIKHIVTILIILAGAFFMYLGFGSDQWVNFIIGLMLICFGTTLMQIQKSSPEPLRQTLTILMCGLCGLTKVRNFQTGDFVFEKKDRCTKCDDLMEIKQIYSVKLKRPTEPGKKQEKLKQELETKK